MENNVLKFVQIKMIGCDMMFVCLDCHSIFQEPKHYTETHGLSSPPYEELDGCPYCGGAYANAYKCCNCAEWITDDYIKVDGERYCDECYCEFTLGCED